MDQEPVVADSPRVFLLTFGPGAAVWERFGHNALWIHDPVAGTDIAYHYGLFDMSEEGFLLEFLRGRMSYAMGSADALRLVDAYRHDGRSTTIQELAIPAAGVKAMQEFLEWNLRPENRVYRYDYFRDNCSTRIRDVLDGALEGTLSAALRARATPITWRAEALALTAEDELLTAGMDLGLGPLADRDISRWELAFIPMRLRDDIRALTVERGEARVPLVVMERELPAAGAADESLAVPGGAIDARVAWMLLLGLLGAALFAALGWLATQGREAGPARRVARWTLAVAGSFWGLLAGVLGLILLALWTLTDHEFAHANENLFQVNPLALALAVLVPLAVAGRATRAAFITAGVLAALSAVGALLHPLPLTPQDNLAVIALAFPVHLGLLYALSRLPRRGG
ncbi:MAG TPA: DUF4105 domain-containing protein [Longimicrobiales bacterium]|nr:DUF4105 domain-containing protein [Longimicrobiales bacterium]